MGKLTVDVALIRELAAVLNETGLTEIEISDDDCLVRIAKQQNVTTTAQVVAPLAASAQGTVVVDAAAALDADHPGAVTSPMVGTAYRSSEPSGPSFVNIGDKVSLGDTLLIIEAMKTFNEIHAPVAGTVKEIMFENQSPVEFGDVLMIIE